MASIVTGKEPYTGKESCRASGPKESRALFILTIAFVVSRTAYFLLGNRFAMNLWFWQFLDTEALRSRLWQSLWYLHSQPPLLNLMLGAGLKLFPESYPVVFQVTFAILGLSMALVLFSLISELGVPVWLALAITLSFELGPATLMYETSFYDTYPTAFTLCFGAFCLNRFLREGGRNSYGVGFVCCLILPVLFNSSFQIVWPLGAFGIFYAAIGNRMRVLVRPALALLAAVIAWYAKNLLLFGTLSTSSWLGMNLATMSTYQLGVEQRVQLVSRGRLSLASLVGTFPQVVAAGAPEAGAVPLAFPFPQQERAELARQLASGGESGAAVAPEQAPAGLVMKLPLTGVPVLDATTKSALYPTGYPSGNYNNLAYVALSKLCLRDAVRAARAYPAAYLHAIAVTAEIYLQPATFGQAYRPALVNQIGMSSWMTLYNLVLLPLRTSLGRNGASAWLPVYASGYVISLTLLIAIPVLTVFGIALVIRGWTEPDRARSATLLFISLSIVYVGTTGILFNAQENNRFRYTVDPLYLVLLAILLDVATGTFLRRPRGSKR